MTIAQSSQRLRETGQATMFDLFGAEVATPLAGIDLESAPVPKTEVLAWEKELIGVWLSEHPYTHAASVLAQHVSALCSEITLEMLADAPPQGREVIIAGIVGASRRLSTRDGRAFIAVEVEDLSGTLEVTVWPDVYERTPDLWTRGRIVLVQLRVRERGDRLTAGVVDVVAYEENFAPPTWAHDVRQPGAGGTEIEFANGNGHAGNGNGFANGNGHGQSTAVGEAFRPPTDLPPYETVRTAVLESSAPADVEEETDEEGRPIPAPDPTPIFEELAPDIEEAPEPAAADLSGPSPNVEPFDPSAGSGRSEVRAEALRLYLEESEDEQADQERLALVFDLLRTQPGPDAVFLTILTREGEEIDLALPGASLDATLRERLEAAVGSQAIATACMLNIS
jgi:hypothetical protein